MGYSNGGFFAAMIAFHQLLDAQGFAILHAGHCNGASFAAEKAKPCLLIAAGDDPWQKPKMIALHDVLCKSGWTSDLQIRAGSHILSKEDSDKAMQFFMDLT
jgi:predicted esterase